MCKIRSYYKPFAIIIKFFHASWILMVFVLTIIEIINHDYAIYQAFIIFVTFIFQLLSGKNGACPLTVWENQLYLKYDPSKVYFNSLA
jgi:hypothetical protein